MSIEAVTGTVQTVLEVCYRHIPFLETAGLTRTSVGITLAMNNSFTNTTNATLGPPGRPSFSYYSLTVTVFFLTPLLLFNILLTVAIVIEKSIARTLRLVLVNIVTSVQVVIVGAIMFFISNVIISGCWCSELRPSDFACRWMYWVIASGGAARLMYMTTFAISVYVLVRFGETKMKIWVATVAVVGVWVAALLPNTAIFSPDVVLINFHNNDSCAAHGTGYKTFIYAFSYTGVYGLLGFAVSVLCTIATISFIRHNTVGCDITLVKAMIKLSVFLILGNIINFIGQTTPLLFAAFAPAGKDWYTLEKAFNYVEGVFILLSLVPTPVLILIYFKPVRIRVKRILCGVCIKTKNVSEKSKSGKAATGSEGNAHSTDLDMIM